MAIHSSILAWRIKWTEEPGRYSPWRYKESDRVEWLSLSLSLSLSHTHTHTHTHIHIHTNKFSVNTRKINDCANHAIHNDRSSHCFSPPPTAYTP